MKGDFSLETVREVWNNKSGERIEVGPDRDALDLIEIRYYGPDDKIISRITLTLENAPLVAKAILACAEEEKLKFEESKKDK